VIDLDSIVRNPYKIPSKKIYTMKKGDVKRERCVNEKTSD
jgi:hypothetical protein